MDWSDNCNYYDASFAVDYDLNIENQYLILKLLKPQQ